MKRNRLLAIMVLALLWVCGAYSQEQRTEMCVYFRPNRTVIDSTYMNNAAHLQEITAALRNIRQDSTVNVVKVLLYGAASPEGRYEWNKELARERLSSLESLVQQYVDLPDSIVTRDDSFIPWDDLKARIENSDIQGKEEVVAIIEDNSQLADPSGAKSSTESRIAKLQQLNGGKVWQLLNVHFFSHMRNAGAIIDTYKSELPPEMEHPVIPEPEPEIQSEPEPIEIVAPAIPVEEGWHRQLHLKTNAVGWVLLITNLAVEVDLAKHWSLTIPVYFSSWNYFTSTVKFRTLAIQPELRYWFSEKNHRNEGWFVGAHFGLAYFNLAVNGDYRYQDHKRHSPAPGGGVSGGYRKPVSRNHRWWMELTLGAGAYSLSYDKLYNTARTTDGRLVESKKKKTYRGIDQAAVTFSYSFDLKKKGGGK